VNRPCQPRRLGDTFRLEILDLEIDEVADLARVDVDAIRKLQRSFVAGSEARDAARAGDVAVAVLEVRALPDATPSSASCRSGSDGRRL
jgi:hypothetical protein